MSYVIAAPEYVTAAAADLANIGSTISEANSAAAPISTVLPAGADEVSAGIAALFEAHAQVYQALSAQAAAFHDQFVQLMNFGSQQYALSEAANLSTLIGGGANGAPGSGTTPPAAAFSSTTSVPAQPAAAVLTTGPAGSTPGPAVPAGTALAPASAIPAGSAGRAVRESIQPLPAGAAGSAEPGVSSPSPLTALPAGLATRAAAATAASSEGRWAATEANPATPG
jgi:hypothetical protein